MSAENKSFEPIEPLELDRSDILQWLEKLLASAVFSTSPKHQEFLRYLVMQTLNGNGARLKGYSIGVEALGRPPQFDPSRDAIVRVEANRLRAKLCEYYQNIGAKDEVHFHLRKGNYQILFHKPMQSVPPIQVKSSVNRLMVVPLLNQSQNSALKYFSDGMTDGIISTLSKSPNLSVLPREISVKYYDSEKCAEEIADEVDANYVIEGSTENINDKPHISIRFLDINLAKCIWSKEFHVETHHLSTVFDEILLHVESSLSQEVVVNNRREYNERRKNATKPLQTSSTSAAHISYLRGLDQYWKNTYSSMSAAKELFLMALEFDPNYAPAHAWLARTLIFQWIMFWENNEEVIDLAYHHAALALKINPELPITNSVYGWAALWRRNGVDAITYCKNSVDLDSSNLDGLFFLATSFCSCGNGEDGLKHIKLMMQLTHVPSPLQYYILGQAYYVLGNYEEAISAWQIGCNISKKFMPNHFYLCLLFSMLGENEKAEKIRSHVIKTLGNNRAPVRALWIDNDLAIRHNQLIQQAGFSV